MRNHLLVTAVCLTVSLFGHPLPEGGQASGPEVPVGALCSTTPPQGSVWVKATVLSRTGSDTYRIADPSGQVTLFLPSDELMSLELCPGLEILVFGTVDVSSVAPQKNELYAERIVQLEQRSGL